MVDFLKMHLYCPACAGGFKKAIDKILSPWHPHHPGKGNGKVPPNLLLFVLNPSLKEFKNRVLLNILLSSFQLQILEGV